MNGEVRAVFLDGVTSRPREVTLVFRPDRRLELRGLGAEPMEFARAQVKVESRLGDAPRFVRLPGDVRCEVRDSDALDAALAVWSPSGTDRGQWLHRIERSWRLVLASVVVLLSIAWVTFRHGVPWGAKQVAFMLPAELTTKLGDETMAVFDRTWFEPSSLPVERRDALKTAFENFLRAADEKGIYRMEVRASRLAGANAFALPSGVIVVTDDLVKLAKHDDEILGVLAHEAGHVKHRHVLRGVLQNAVLAVVVTLLTGDVSTTTAAAGAAPAYLLQSGFSREFEREADAEGVRMMRRAGLDPGHLAKMLERLERSHRLADEAGETGDDDEAGVMDYIGSHPPTRERLKSIRGERGEASGPEAEDAAENEK